LARHTRQSDKKVALSYPKRPYTASTRRLYVAALKRFVDFRIAEDRLDDIDMDVGKAEAELRSLRSKRGAAPYHRPAIAPELAWLITYYDDVPLPDPDERDAERLTLEQFRNRALMHTLYASGGRISEVLRMTRAGVRAGRLDEVTVKGKGGKDRDLLLTPESQAAIRDYCRARGMDPYPALFISHRRGLGRPLTRVSGWAIVKRAAHALGLDKEASPHKFRHFRG